MKSSAPEPLPLPPTEEQLTPVPTEVSFWSSTRRRRPAFLLLLGIGLILFIALSPDDARASLWIALEAQRGLVSLLFLFALVTLSLIWSTGQRWDSRIFLLFNQHSYFIWLDRCMWLFTQFGNMLSAFIAAFLFFLLNDRRLAVEIVFGTLTLWLLVETIKVLAGRDRPFLAIEGTRIVGWREKGDSFPSGHTSQIFFLATLLILRFHLSLGTGLALYALAALVGFTRIYVGAHYPRDVLGGAVLGSIWGILAILVNPALLAG